MDTMKKLTDSHTDRNRLKKRYTKPQLLSYGSVATLTRGNGGSSIDGNGTLIQTGGGNDGTGPHQY